MPQRPITTQAPAPVPVGLHSPWRWLALGWADLRSNPLPGLIHGFMLTAFGGILLWALSDWFWVLAGAFSGFLIVAPVLATGLYQVSRGASVIPRASVTSRDEPPTPPQSTTASLLAIFASCSVA